MYYQQRHLLVSLLKVSFAPSVVEVKCDYLAFYDQLFEDFTNKKPSLAKNKGLNFFQYQQLVAQAAKRRVSAFLTMNQYTPRLGSRTALCDRYSL